MNIVKVKNVVRSAPSVTSCIRMNILTSVEEISEAGKGSDNRNMNR